MKGISQITILLMLLLICPSFICQDKNKNRNKKYKDKNKGKNLQKSHNNNTASDLNKIQTKKVIVNSVGNEVVIKNITATEFPFVIKRCDQIIYFEGQYIKDIEQYSMRKNAYFSITAYHLNAFYSKNPAALFSSFLLTDMTADITSIRGARGCLRISENLSTSSHKPLLVCTGSEENSNNILEIINTFKNCRKGIKLLDNTNTITSKPSQIVKKVHQLVENCEKVNAHELIKKIRRLKKIYKKIK